MKPIKYKDKGPAVEDIQRRLRVLGHVINEESTTAEFLDDTLAAVSAFQRAKGIEPTGAVGPRTWSTLVDSTFELGDRMLYLRMPYFHGADVTQLQHALNSLGFATGGIDGIFGASTERAVTEFQANYDINPDGLVGNDTLRALLDLRHMWGTKEGRAHSSVQGTTPKQYQALTSYYFDFQANGTTTDASTSAVIRRLVRHANNLEDAARADLPQSNADTATLEAATTVLVKVIAESAEPIESVRPTEPAEPTGSAKLTEPAEPTDLKDSKDSNNNNHTSDINNTASSSVIFQNNPQAFAASLKDSVQNLQKLKSETENSSHQDIQSAIQVPIYELRVIIPMQLLEAGVESSLPVGLQLMASRLLDGLCLAVIS